MSTFNVIFIAPEVQGLDKLAVWDEVYLLEDISGVHIEKIMGPGIDRRRLQPIFEKSYDVMLWAGHGQAGRLRLSTGHITPRALANAMHKYPPAVIIVSACFSAVRDDKIMNSIAECLAGAGIDTIAMQTSIEDKAAMVYDVEIVRCLAAGAEFDEAHWSALEALRSLNGAAAAIVPMQFYGKHPRDLMAPDASISQKLCDINKRLDAITELVRGVGDITVIQQRMIDYLRDSQQAILQVVQTISQAKIK